jgi:pimeloyl-ACP methyl ester carboxylesterase
MNHAPHLTFLHANGYPSGVYRQFFEALGKHAVVRAPALLETALDCPPHKRWPTMLDNAVRMVHKLDSGQTGSRHILVGHSMGGYLALQLAARQPELISDVVLIESPIPTGWRSRLLTFSQLTGLAYRAGPAPIAARRRDHWPSRAAAKEFFAGKKFVQRWSPGVLDDFIEHAIATADNGVTLRVPRDTERDIYANIVHRGARADLYRLQRSQVRVSFIAGKFSEELRLAGASDNERLFAPNYFELPHGHLIPLEAPLVCATAVLAAVNKTAR